MRVNIGRVQLTDSHVFPARTPGKEGRQMSENMEWDGYLYAAPNAAPPARAGAQQHTLPSSAQFYVVATL
jgi:hypothetical protein